MNFISLKNPRAVSAAASLLLLAGLHADPLSKKMDIDFFEDVPSRNLSGLATRSDGRLVAGPVLSDLKGTAPAELLWALAPAGTGHWLLATGPDGGVFDVSVDGAGKSFRSRELVHLNDPQVFAVLPLPDGSFLAGTSPNGRLALVRRGKVVAEVSLPVSSVFDFLADPAAAGPGAVLVATGNPGRIYRVDLARFAAGGVNAAQPADPHALAQRGITVFSEIADNNVRRLARLSDGRVVAGSSPSGNIYEFPAAGGPPVILAENPDAEVTDLLPAANGDLFATIVFSSSDEELHTEKNPLKTTPLLPPPVQPEKFKGHSVLMRYPSDGFPELLTARANAAFYHLARRGDVLLVSGGEEGQILGYDLDARLALTFAGSPAARLNGLFAVPGSADAFLVLQNNAPGLALLDFGGAGERRATTREIDLELPSRLGALRFDRLREVAEAKLTVEIRTSNGSDEREGWGPWTTLTTAGDGWRGPELRGRYVQVRVSAPADARQAQLGRAALYYLPQNRRPLIQDFHLVSPNYALVPPPESAGSSITTLGQLMEDHDDDKKKDRLLSAQVVPSPGTQAVFWSASDPSGDNLVATFSIRREGESAWTDIAVDTRDSYAQFDISNLPEGIYFTRLVVKQAAPRPAADRLSAAYETDDLVVDHTPPEIFDATVRRSGDSLVVSVRGRGHLSLLDSLEADFNNGAQETVEQPADGIRDGREETFEIEEPLAAAAGATAVEVTLYDASGNSATRRLPLPK